MMTWGRAINREWHFGEFLEIEQTSITPPPCVFCLSLKTCELLCIGLLMDVWFHLLPDTGKGLCLSYSLVVGVAERIL